MSVKQQNGSARVHLANKQRLHPVDLPWWRGATNKLALEVFANVQRNLPSHLSDSDACLVLEKGTVGLSFVSNKSIRKLNKQWREKDYATDVLSFPLIFEQTGASFSPECDLGEEMELGEIVISVEKAAEQAAEYAHSFDREMAFLFVHGLLHVLGFDHETKEQEAEMFSRQTAVLNCLGFVK